MPKRNSLVRIWAEVPTRLSNQEQKPQGLLTLGDELITHSYGPATLALLQEFAPSSHTLQQTKKNPAETES